MAREGKRDAPAVFYADDGDFVTKGPRGARWEWDGNKEKPTLSPSLGLHRSHEAQTVGADGYHWHGYLRAGIFEEC